MYQLSDQQVEYILSDIRKRGIQLEYTTIMVAVTIIQFQITNLHPHIANNPQSENRYMLPHIGKPGILPAKAEQPVPGTNQPV